jgi:hypothetical protein
MQGNWLQATLATESSLSGVPEGTARCRLFVGVLVLVAVPGVQRAHISAALPSLPVTGVSSFWPRCCSRKLLATARTLAGRSLLQGAIPTHHLLCPCHLVPVGQLLVAKIAREA